MRFPTSLRRVAAVAALTFTATVAAAEIRRPLSDAAWRVDRDGVRKLLKEGADVNGRDGDGATALIWASYRDDLETVDLLLRSGAQVNAANNLGATALWAASQNGSAAMIARLVSAKADPNLALTSGETPLMVAARVGSTAVVSQLLKAGAKVDAKGTRGQTALMWAVAQQHHGVTKLLIEAGANIHERSSVWNMVMAVTPHGMMEYNRTIPHGSDTALMFAARNGDLESAKLLVAAGANPKDKEAAGITAVAMAAHAGFTEIVEFLLDKGADPNGSEGGFTALHAAIMRRDERMAKALLAHKADPNEPVRMWTPTRRSSRDWNFNPEMVGATPFWLAARTSSPGIMRLLVDHGAQAKVVHHVKYHGGDPPVPRQQTTTPLMAAVGMGGGFVWVPADSSQREALALECAKLALELGSDINAANDDGRTALDGATQARFPKVVAFLTENGAKPGTPTNRRPGAPTNR